MTVRSKFKCTAITINEGQKPTGEKDANGYDKYGPCKTYNIAAYPVYGNGDPEHENTKFFLATPSGRYEINGVDEEVAKHFEVGKEFYLDATFPVN